MCQGSAWAANWCPTSYGTGSSRCCPCPWSRRSEAARDARTVPACAASSSFSERASPGAISPQTYSAVVASLVGDGSRSGARRECFAACSAICSMSLGSRERSTGAESRSIPVACELSEGDQHRSEPDGPRQTGLETPSCRGPAGSTFDCAPHSSQPARQNRGAAADRRHPADSGTSRPPATAPAQAARRQGVRLRRHSPRTALSPHHPEDRPKRCRVDREAGTSPLGRRAHARVVASVQATAGSRRAPWGNAPHAAGAGLLPDPLSRRREAFLKPALKRACSVRDRRPVLVRFDWGCPVSMPFKRACSVRDRIAYPQDFQPLAPLVSLTPSRRPRMAQNLPIHFGSPHKNRARFQRLTERANRAGPQTVSEISAGAAAHR